MIKITALRDEKEQLLFLEARGHSGYSSEGQDIVCSAVSTLIQTLAVGLIDVLHLENIEEHIDPEKACMSYRWREPVAPELKVLTETIFLSLKGIQQAYPDYIKIFEGELT